VILQVSRGESILWTKKIYYSSEASFRFGILSWTKLLIIEPFLKGIGFKKAIVSLDTRIHTADAARKLHVSI
jgi:hypothetical protein